MMMKEGVDISQQHEEQEVVYVHEELLHLQDSVLLHETLYEELDRPLTVGEKTYFGTFWGGKVGEGKRKETEIL